MGLSLGSASVAFCGKSTALGSAGPVRIPCGYSRGTHVGIIHNMYESNRQPLHNLLMNVPILDMFGQVNDVTFH